MLSLMPYARANKHPKLEILREEMKASPSQLYKEVDVLKHALSGESLSDTESWKARQELCHLLESLLLLDLDYALDKKVEQDLWSFIFRNPIAACQSKAKEQKSPNNAYPKSQLSSLLDTASGFYLQLLQKLCCAYDIDLPCHPKDSVYGLTKELICCYPVVHQPRKSSLFYICQHCLVHLGDIARYRGQSLQAENFYRHAVDLVPSNGQPYNQLALLEAASGEKLSTVFFYVRSLCVQHPFPLAANNLQILFSKMSNDGAGNEGKLRILTAFEYLTTFLHFQAAVYLNTDIKKAKSLVGQLTSSLPSLIIAEKFETWQLVQMVAICLFAIAHCWGTGNSDKSTKSTSENYMNSLTAEELKAGLLIEELLGGLLYAFLLPLHASPEPKDTAMYYTLPAVKIILDWLLQDPKLLLHEPLNQKHQIWHALCKLLNDLEIVSSAPFDVKKFEDLPLPEDWDLQCFLPLKESQRRLKFNLSAETPNDEESVWLRSVRLCKIGEHLSDGGKECLNILGMSYVSGHRHFKAIHQVETLTEKVLQQIQDLDVSSNLSVVSNQITEIPLHPVNGNIHSPDLIPVSIRTKSNSIEGQLQQEVRFKLDDIPARKENFEMKREEKLERRIKECPSIYNGVGRRMVKNVAMQAILQQQANQNPTNILGRNPDFRKETLLQSELIGRQTRPQSRVEGSLHLCANPGSRTPQPVQEVILNRSKLNHIQTETYNPLQCPLQTAVEMNGSNDREPWIQPFNMHQANISNVSSVVHNTMNGMGNYLQNSASHLMQSSSSDVSQHQNQQTSQPSHVNKQVSSSQQNYLSNPTPNMLWNYMNFMASYQQPYTNGDVSSSTPLAMQPGNNHQSVSHIQQQQKSYYLMNGTHSKLSPGKSVQPPMTHSYRSSASEDTLIPYQASDIFHDKGSEQQQSSNHSISNNMWKLDSSLSNDLRTSQFPVNQAVNRAVGQTIQNNHASPIRDCGSASSASSSCQDLGSSTYSLFNSPWPSGLSVSRINKEGQHHDSGDSIILPTRVQSLWSGPGPSALERLLEQQKQRRDTTAL